MRRHYELNTAFMCAVGLIVLAQPIYRRIYPNASKGGNCCKFRRWV